VFLAANIKNILFGWIIVYSIPQVLFFNSIFYLFVFTSQESRLFWHNFYCCAIKINCSEPRRLLKVQCDAISVAVFQKIRGPRHTHRKTRLRYFFLRWLIRIIHLQENPRNAQTQRAVAFSCVQRRKVRLPEHKTPKCKLHSTGKLAKQAEPKIMC